jgi:type II secretory pathway pseudopilin PulG
MNAVLVIASLSLAAGPAAVSSSSSEAETAAVQKAAQAAEAAQKAAEAAQKAAEAAEKTAQENKALTEQIAADRAKIEAMRAAEKAAADKAAADKEAAAKAEAAKPKDVGWSGTANLALISLTGNADTLTLSFGGTIERKVADWIFSAKGTATYGQSRPTDSGPSSVTALGAGLQLRGERHVTDRVLVYLLGGGDTDHVKSLEFRGYGEGGASVNWFTEKEGDLVKSEFTTDLGLRYAHETRFNFYPTPSKLPDADASLTLVAPRFGFKFKYAVTKDILFTEGAEILVNIWGTSRQLVNNTTTLSMRLTEAVSVNTSFGLAYDSTPAPDKKSLDTTLQFGVGVAF